MKFEYSELLNDERVVSRYKKDHIYFIGLNRPAKRNAFNNEMRIQLSHALAEMENDPDIRCGILFAHGEHFTGGLDLIEVGGAIKQGDMGIPEGGLDWKGFYTEQRTKPLLCVIQGWCLTLGIEIVLASDIRIASETTKFSQMEIARGIYPFGGATIRFPREIGWGNAMRWILTGDTFDVNEAHRIGLVQEITENGQQMQRAYEIAMMICEQSPLGVQTTLKASVEAMRHGEIEASKKLLPHLLALMDTEDAVEGNKSFIEKRKAVFVGR